MEETPKEKPGEEPGTRFNIWCFNVAKPNGDIDGFGATDNIDGENASMYKMS